MAAVAAVTIAVIGAGATAYSTHQAAEAREDEADRMKDEGKRAAEVHRRQTERLTSKQRAAYAASGVRVGEGTPLAVIEATQRDADEEREEILKGYGYRSDALKKDASRIRVSGYSSAAGTLLGGAAGYASSPYAKNPFASTPTTYTPSYPLSGPTHHSR